jgi:hypothetical protein
VVKRIAINGRGVMSPEASADRALNVAERGWNRMGHLGDNRQSDIGIFRLCSKGLGRHYGRKPIFNTVKGVPAFMPT